MIEKAGKYRAKACEVMLGKSSGKGTPFVGVMFEVTQGDLTGTRVKWEGWLTDKTAERVFESLQHCGWHGDDLSQFAGGNLHGLDTNEVELVVEMEEYNGDDPKHAGKSFPKVQWVNKVGSGPKFSGESMDVAQAAAFGQKFRGLAAAVRAKSGQPSNATPAPVQSSLTDDIPF